MNYVRLDVAVVMWKQMCKMYILHISVHFVEGGRVDYFVADTAVVGAISNPQITTTPPLSIQRTPPSMLPHVQVLNPPNKRSGSTPVVGS